ncbi:MAG: 16S rRNA (cytosine(1402)-N(4))-methyltransferase RsmH [Candidatus Omnitrophota bacterium]|nr:16S rRNA (cytosine(1402)-N(4))-methyltransferase RsmH [Candidatus Omnitrophota bacterium]
MLHKPVLIKETLDCLAIPRDAVAVDGTLGDGGHAEEMLKRLGPGGRLIAIDQDPQAILRCRERFKDYRNISFHHENFRNMPAVLDSLNIVAVDAVLLDIGFSSDQLEDASRGFSFARNGPLDMRMNPDLTLQAFDIVNGYRQQELEKVFYEFGEQRWSRRFARQIVEERHKKPILTTTELAEVLERSVPGRFSHPKSKRPSWSRHHPATRAFQALRIAVNDELGALEEGLDRMWPFLRSGGRLATITFHSLEDRIVKNRFRNWARSGEAILVHKKPVTPGRDETVDNPRARSAKLRVVERTDERIS